MTKDKDLQISNFRYRLGYHIMPQAGWINDPNGFSYFNGYYHIFYQHYPYAAEWGPMHWGHARSKDLVHWETLPIALYPGDTEDKDGCFSGTAIVEEDTLYLFYTGHHYYEDNNPDHFWQTQNMAYSKDGIHFHKYHNNPIIPTPPEDNTHHFRDPKIWKAQNYYYMIIGSQNKQQLGRIVLYRSQDLTTWENLGPVDESQGQDLEGYMWECPDLFELDGRFVFLFSPQGMSSESEQYLNLFQNGYFIGDFNYETYQFSRNHFKELDHGHDFYAPQTMKTPDGRRILIGWMAMWESNMPEQEDGWSGALTLPRELYLKGNHLYMRPIEELKQLRLHSGTHANHSVSDSLLLSENKKQVEINLTLENKSFHIQFKNSSANLLSIKYNAEDCKFTLYRNDIGDYRYAKINQTEQLKLQLFIDTSSVETFINEGEAVFTERFYSETPPEVWISARETVDVKTEIYELKNQTIQFD